MSIEQVIEEEVTRMLRQMAPPETRRRSIAAITQTELANELGVCRETVRKWTATGRIPVWFRDDNGRPVYNLDVIEAAQRRAGELHAELQAAP